MAKIRSVKPDNGDNKVQSEQPNDEVKVAENSAVDEKAEAAKANEKAEAKRLEEERVAKAEADRIEAEKKAEAAKVATKNADIAWSGVKDILTKQGLTFDKKIIMLKENGSVSVKGIVSKLESYRDIMSPKSIAVTPAAGAAKNFDLLATLKSVTNEADYAVFKAKFDLVNAYFKEHADDAYSEWLLHRFDTEWIWGKESLTAYQFLVTTITMLCNKVTRAAELKKISLNSALNKEATKLSDTSIENIKKYYRS